MLPARSPRRRTPGCADSSPQRLHREGHHDRRPKHITAQGLEHSIIDALDTHRQAISTDRRAALVVRRARIEERALPAMASARGIERLDIPPAPSAARDCLEMGTEAGQAAVRGVPELVRDDAQARCVEREAGHRTRGRASDERHRRRWRPGPTAGCPKNTPGPRDELTAALSKLLLRYTCGTVLDAVWQTSHAMFRARQAR